MSNVVRYLPTKKFHILPLRGLSPEELKNSAKNCLRDREKIKHNSLLNLVVKELGFKGGFSDYREIYSDSIKPFMEHNGLHFRADLLHPAGKPAGAMVQLKLSVEQVCGRLFQSGSPLPKKLFTGHNFDYHAHYDDGKWTFNRIMYHQFGGIPSIGSTRFYELIEKAKQGPDSNFGDSSRRTRDMVVGGFYFECIFPSFNLLGDFLIEPASDNSSLPKLYCPQSYDPDCFAEEYQGTIKLADLFREEIESSERGWVEVIPFNDRLVFFKGADGKYDFVVPGLRSAAFEHQIYDPFLKRSDVPAQMNEAYHFLRWYYFEFSGWREQAEHLAEQYYYAGGGSLADYPGELEILRASLLKRKLYHPPSARSEVKKDCPLTFNIVQLDGKRLYVSNLVPISELAKFSNRRSDYFSARELLENAFKIDRLVSMNVDQLEAPATVTWFDACAYAKYFEDVYQLPVRLLKIAEYLELRSPTSGGAPRGLAGEPDLRPNELLEFFEESSGRNFGAHPPYMNETSFQNLQCRFRNQPELVSNQQGLHFVNSDNFAEWLYENPNGKMAAAVRSKSLVSIYGSDSLNRDLVPASSTGKAKHIKIGFRLCFEADH